MQLASEQRTKLDNSDDALFYDYPRFVTHVDDRFIQQLTELYRQRLQPNTCILDLTSSWVSHLPDEMEFAHIEGHGLNAEELARNPHLHHYFVQNLNQQQLLPFADRSFDAVLIQSQCSSSKPQILLKVLRSNTFNKIQKCCDGLRPLQYFWINYSELSEIE